MKKYYCWVVLACLFLMYMASNGIVLNTFNLYLPEFARAFNVDIGKATGLAATLYLVLALPLPFVGNLLEKFSPKKIILTGAFGVSAGLYFLSIATSFKMIQLFVIVYPLFLCLVGLLTSMYVINNWFVKYKGIATGILLMASSVGPAIFASIVGKWIKTLGWQAAVQNQFILCSCLIIIPALLIYSHPSIINSSADGIPGTIGRQPKVDKVASRALLKKALLSLDFYLVALITAALWFCIGGFIQNQRNYQVDLHLDVEQSGLLQSVFFLFGLLGKLLFGYLGDKFSVKKIMLLSVFNMLLGCLLLYWSLRDNRWVVPCAIVFGLGYSGTFTMIQLYIIDLFGGAAYGTILGLLSFIDTLCASIGVAVLGSMRKVNGNYEKAFMVMIVLTIFSLMATYYINHRAQKGAIIS
ncbi:MAG: MFS transporter [Bacteroidota bacterium]|jgi:MFS family permease